MKDKTIFHLLFLLISLFMIMKPCITQQCVNATCISKEQTSTSLCLKQTDGTATSGGNVYFVYDKCDTTSREYCDPDIDSTTYMYTGSCSKNTSTFEYFPTYIQYPGELCDQNRAFYECGFGYRKCIANRCYGYLRGENCITSADCNPHSYCDQSTQTCATAKAADAVCTSNDQCDMEYICKFESSLATSGRCKKYFSLASGSPVYATKPSDLFVCTDGYGYLDIPSNGVADLKNFQSGLYRCGKEMKSTNAGKECSSYKDCPTSITGVYANCGCTYSSFSKRCDILYSNYEYQQFIDAAKEFQSATSYCHNARNLESGPCDKLTEFRNMMCKKLKAYYYLPNYDADQCLLTYSNQYLFSEIDETQNWCNPKRLSTLLGLDYSIFLNAYSTGLVIASLLYLTMF